jgi:F0F1-type ATP synthase membrane subunit b/b'
MTILPNEPTTVVVIAFVLLMWIASRKKAAPVVPAKPFTRHQAIIDAEAEAARIKQQASEEAALILLKAQTDAANYIADRKKGLEHELHKPV